MTPRQVELSTVWQEIPVVRDAINFRPKQLATEALLDQQRGHCALPPGRICRGPTGWIRTCPYRPAAFDRRFYVGDILSRWSGFVGACQRVTSRHALILAWHMLGCKLLGLPLRCSKRG